MLFLVSRLSRGWEPRPQSHRCNSIPHKKKLSHWRVSWNRPDFLFNHLWIARFALCKLLRAVLLRGISLLLGPVRPLLRPQLLILIGEMKLKWRRLRAATVGIGKNRRPRSYKRPGIIMLWSVQVPWIARQAWRWRQCLPWATLQPGILCWYLAANMIKLISNLLQNQFWRTNTPWGRRPSSSWHRGVVTITSLRKTPLTKLRTPVALSWTIQGAPMWASCSRTRAHDSNIFLWDQTCS